MSRITSRVKSIVDRAVAEYGDPCIVVDRNGSLHSTQAIARRSVFVQVAEATYSEYYFLMAREEFDRITDILGRDSNPPAWFGGEQIIFDGQTYILRRTEPWEWVDGTRQAVRIWGTIKR